MYIPKDNRCAFAGT